MDGRKQRGPNVHHGIMTAIVGDVYSGLTEAEACDKHGVRVDTWRLWCKKADEGVGGYEELRETLRAYRALEHSNLLDIVLAGLDSKRNVATVTTTTYDKHGNVKGSTVRVEQKAPPVDLALRLLALRDPKHWAEKLVLDTAQRKVLRELIEGEVRKATKG